VKILTCLNYYWFYITDLNVIYFEDKKSDITKITSITNSERKTQKFLYMYFIMSSTGIQREFMRYS